ncbi:hypothetical protein ABZ746_00205 [Streptomyces sp. NPDC020096]
MADPISENGLATLTRRYEDTRTDLETIKHDVLTIRTELNSFRTEVRGRFDAQDTKFNALDGKVDAFITEQRSVNAALVDLLTNLVGRTPDTA